MLVDVCDVRRADNRRSSHVARRPWPLERRTGRHGSLTVDGSLPNDCEEGIPHGARRRLDRVWRVHPNPNQRSAGRTSHRTRQLRISMPNESFNTE